MECEVGELSAIARLRLHNHALFAKHWFMASGTDVYPVFLKGEGLKRLIEYRKDFHRTLLPEVDDTTIGIVDVMCEMEFRRQPRKLERGENYCGLCDEVVEFEKWDEHRGTMAHTAIEADVQRIYSLWEHIKEVRRRRYEERGAPDSVLA